MEISIIISYYKALNNLKIILKGLNNQSNKNFEVILSEDDFNEETISFISQNQNLYHFNILHLHQTEDIGFRKNIMLNKCITNARTEKLVFIDGDCVPHKHFVKEYIKHLEEGYFYSGRSVMLGEKISKKIIENQLLKKLNIFSLLFSDSNHVKAGFYFPFFPLSYKTRGLVGRNWGVYKKHLLDINGFDQDYIEAGVGEDTDVAWRLLESGIQIKSIKNKAIIYHLYHKRTYSTEKVRLNFKLMTEKKQEKNFKCLNGIQTISKLTIDN